MNDGPQEPAADSDIPRLTAEIGGVLRRAVSESPQVASCLARARAAGFEVSLAIEATIAVRRGERSSGPNREVAAGVPRLEFAVSEEPGEPEPLRMTPLDRKFLRSLKIAIEDE